MLSFSQFETPAFKLICLIKKHEFLKCELENIDGIMPEKLRNML